MKELPRLAGLLLGVGILLCRRPRATSSSSLRRERFLGLSICSARGNFWSRWGAPGWDALWAASGRSRAGCAFSRPVELSRAGDIWASLESASAGDAPRRFKRATSVQGERAARRKLWMRRGRESGGARRPIAPLSRKFSWRIKGVQSRRLSGGPRTPPGSAPPKGPPRPRGRGPRRGAPGPPERSAGGTTVRAGRPDDSPGH